MFRVAAFYSCLFSFCALIVSFVSATTLQPMPSNKYKLTTEDKLTEDYSPEINQFWQENALSKSFQSKHGGTIHTIHINTGKDKAVVISQGRNESVLKYKELVFDLHQQGYDSYLIDHRGQGFSDRLGGDQHRGYVESFQFYVDDLELFVEQLNLPTQYSTRYLMAHSMGSTISALYLQQKTHPFQAAAFFSPMFSINLGILPTFLAKFITYLVDLICGWFSDLASYIPGGGAYKSKHFTGNQLTHSYKRFQSAMSTFDKAPATQLGSPTMRWVNESLHASEDAINNAALIEIPYILLQADGDVVVTNQGQNAFYKNGQHCQQSKLINIAKAKHELLLEEDQYRLTALNETFDFFTQLEAEDLKCIK